VIEFNLPPDPRTLAEWEQLVADHPDSPHLWRPGPQGRRLLGLSRGFGREPKVWNRDRQNQFIATIVNSPEFRRACVHAFQGAL
jgi:hypothetical protein